MTEIVLALIGGLTLGTVHAFDADHMTAVTAFASTQAGVKRGAMFGLVWGLGHSTTLVILGAASVAFKFVIPPIMVSVAELSVGLLLVAIGVWVLCDVFHRKKIHLHKHSHDGVEHAHFHSHRLDNEHRHKHSLFLVGATHGFAGTASVMVVIPIAMTQSLLTAVLYFLCFSIGTIGAMALFASFLGAVTRRAGTTRVLPWLQGTAGIASVCMGLVWLGEFLW
ncbi:MAG: sulfite exporter TauE/SafE family protein [Ignavibacteriales bacterium]|nr:sulfite exporter TauE/SafE family protein [Ignavibacteriales bacterium]